MLGISCVLGEYTKIFSNTETKKIPEGIYPFGEVFSSLVSRRGIYFWDKLRAFFFILAKSRLSRRVFWFRRPVGADASF
jgi:hypothetical protein